MSETTPQSRPKRKTRAKPVARKMSAQRLANIAKYHLERFSTTAAHLRQVLMRRIDRAIRAHGGDRGEVARWVEELLARLIASGALDDSRFASAKAASLRRKGKAPARIRAALRAKGVSAADAALASPDELHPADEDAALAAALAYAKRRRLGPFRPKERLPDDRRERLARWQKDLAAMIRAGFAYDVARRVFAAGA
jgi:regulatory protein